MVSLMENRSFNWRVIDQIEQLIDESGLTRAEVIIKSGMRRNTFFVKMRGETALTTDDIAKIAEALGVEPEVVFVRAAAAAHPNVAQLRPTNVTASRHDRAVAKKRSRDRGGEDGQG